MTWFTRLNSVHLADVVPNETQVYCDQIFFPSPGKKRSFVSLLSGPQELLTRLRFKIIVVFLPENVSYLHGVGRPNI